MALRAGGVVDFRGRAEVAGSVQSAVPTAGPGTGAPAGFSVSVDGGQAAVRGPEGAWAQVGTGAGPLGSVLLEPGAVTRILRGAHGDVEPLGDATVDGARVRRYRFDVEPEALLRADLAKQELQAEAAVDDAGRVRMLHLLARGGVEGRSPLTWRADVTVRLGDFGTPVGGRAPGAAEATATLAPQARSSVLVHPFGPVVAASLRSTSSNGR